MVFFPRFHGCTIFVAKRHGMKKIRGEGDYVGVQYDCGCWALATKEPTICEQHQPQGPSVEAYQAFFKWRLDLMQAARAAHEQEAKDRVYRELIAEPPKKEPESDLDD
jgi:hypothetical protein